MESVSFLRLYPSLSSLSVLFPDAILQASDPYRSFESFRIYTGQSRLSKQTIYLVSPDDDFPVDDYPYVSRELLPGKADHICCPTLTRDVIADRILTLFSQLLEQEHELDALLYRGGTLEELCELAAKLLDNPVYIHDDWFIMMAKSRQVDEFLTPEYVMSSQKGFLPRMIIEDFKDDIDYLETYAHHNAQIWSGGNGTPDALYVNLWDGSVYRGRMLVIASNHSIAPGDYRLAEVLAQAAMLLIQRKKLGEHAGRSMDDIMYELLSGKQPDAASMTQLLNMLKWNRRDTLLCVRLQNQRPEENAVREHALHSDLFHKFPGSYIMIIENQQCMILNLTRTPLTIRTIRHHLAPLCRDYCLYAGLSSPLEGIVSLKSGYYQAALALNQAFRNHDEKWILSFQDCVLEHLVEGTEEPLSPTDLVSPELLMLLNQDQKKGTSYFDTLKEYLLCERDIPKTSEKLIIHRTTLLYRLKKIQSMISSDLDDPWQRLYLMLSLWILDRERES